MPFLPGLATSCLDLRIPTPITVHVDHCPQCAADLAALKGLGLSDEQLGSVGRLYEQTCSGKGGFWRRNAARDDSLPQAVYAIAERPDSGVVTICRTIDEDRKVAAVTGDPYGDYPIRVEFARRDPRSVLPRGRDVLKSRAFRPLAGRILKPAVVVAAVLALAVLFFGTQSTSGVALGDMVRAFGRARNVRIVWFHPVTQEAISELWVSRDLNLMGKATEQECVVYDLATSEEEDMVTGRVSRIDNSTMARVRALADTCLGFSLTDLPADATWTRSDGDDKREVYELLGARKTCNDREIPVRYEVVVDRTTKLPASLRTFYWDPLEMDWECASVIVLDYMTRAQMAGVLERQVPARGK